MLYAIGTFTILTGLSAAGWAYSAANIHNAEDNWNVVFWAVPTLAFGVIDFVLFMTWLAIK